MKKEKVLKFKIMEANNFGITGVLIQNTEILKRNMDTKYSRSYNFPSWDFINKKLYTYGDEKYDNLIFTVPKGDIDLFLEKINCINEKYGIPYRWRAKENEEYFTIKDDGYINKYVDIYCTDDDYKYNLGNYFRTYKEAEEVLKSKEWQEFWAKVRAGEIVE